MKERITLYADDGKILTNGMDYGKIVTLAVGASAADWYEITEEEYNALQPEEVEE